VTNEEKLRILYTNWRDLEIGFFDIETCDKTPEDPLNDIIQFSMATFKDGYKKWDFDIKIRNRNPISEQATKKAHGITEDMLVDCPYIDEGSEQTEGVSVVEHIHNLLNSVEVLCAYNGARFDIVALNRVFADHGLSDISSIPFIDPFIWYVMYKKKFSKSKQEDAARDFSVNILGNIAHGEGKLHDSSIDIIALHDLTFKMGVKAISAYTLKDLMQKQDRYVDKINKARQNNYRF